MRREIVVLITLIITVAVLAVIRAEVEVDLNLHDQEVATLRQEVEAKKMENTILRDKILTAQSLTIIASEAAKMGFEDAGVEFRPRPQLYGQ